MRRPVIYGLAVYWLLCCDQGKASNSARFSFEGRQSSPQISSLTMKSSTPNGPFQRPTTESIWIPPESVQSQIPSLEAGTLYRSDENQASPPHPVAMGEDQRPGASMNKAEQVSRKASVYALKDITEQETQKSNQTALSSNDLVKDLAKFTRPTKLIIPERSTSRSAAPTATDLAGRCLVEMDPNAELEDDGHLDDGPTIPLASLKSYISYWSGQPMRQLENQSFVKVKELFDIIMSCDMLSFASACTLLHKDLIHGLQSSLEYLRDHRTPLIERLEQVLLDTNPLNMDYAYQSDEECENSSEAKVSSPLPSQKEPEESRSIELNYMQREAARLVHAISLYFPNDLMNTRIPARLINAIGSCNPPDFSIAMAVISVLVKNGINNPNPSLEFDIVNAVLYRVHAWGSNVILEKATMGELLHLLGVLSTRLESREAAVQVLKFFSWLLYIAHSCEDEYITTRLLGVLDNLFQRHSALLIDRVASRVADYAVGFIKMRSNSIRNAMLSLYKNFLPLRPDLSLYLIKDKLCDSINEMFRCNSPEAWETAVSVVTALAECTNQSVSIALMRSSLLAHMIQNISRRAKTSQSTQTHILAFYRNIDMLMSRMPREDHQLLRQFASHRIMDGVIHCFSMVYDTAIVYQALLMTMLMLASMASPVSERPYDYSSEMLNSAIDRPRLLKYFKNLSRFRDCQCMAEAAWAVFIGISSQSSVNHSANLLAVRDIFARHRCLI